MRNRFATLAVLVGCGGAPSQPTPEAASPRPPTNRRDIAEPEQRSGGAREREPATTGSSPDADDGVASAADPPPDVEVPEPPEVLGRPGAARMLRARDLRWGEVLVVAAESVRLSIGAVEASPAASPRISVDLAFDGAKSLLGALESSRAFERAPKHRDDAGVAWFVPRGWTPPSAVLRLGRLRCERVDLQLGPTPVGDVLDLLGDVMRVSLRGAPVATTSLRVAGVRCDRIVARLLALSGTGAVRTGDAIELTANPTAVAAEPALAPCPPTDARSGQPFACLFLDEVRLGATLTGTGDATAVIVPRSARRDGRVSLRAGDRLELADVGDPPAVAYRVLSVAAESLTLTREDDPSNTPAVVMDLGRPRPGEEAPTRSDADEPRGGVGTSGGAH